MNKRVAQVIVALPVEGPFDYSVKKEFQDQICEGQRVYVPFQSRQTVGFVVGLRAKSRFKKLRPVLSLLDNVPALEPQALQFTKAFAQYYGCSWGEAIETSLPNALRKKKALQLSIQPSREKDLSKKGEVFLCHDKGTQRRWPFIIARIKQTLSKGQGVIFLVPEVFAIKKIEGILRNHLDVSITVLDKRLTPKRELEQWIMLKEAKSPLVIGTRSAVFAPVANPGLMIVYDEENASYKQEQSPFYHVRDVVDMRRKIEGCSVLFVSSAPSAEEWWRINKQKASMKTFEADHLGQLQLIDLLNYKPRRRSSISFPLQNHIQAALEKKEKIVLFLNRRGFSTTTRCNHCGHIIKCKRCEVNLSYLYSKKKLVCHLCNSSSDLPKLCPECKGSYLRSMGTGIEKIESDLARIFPQARVARFDRETSSIPQQADIIIATQAILKVLDQIPVSLIGVLEIDAELNRIDFRSAQRTFSLLIHLRQAAKEKVLVQTNSVDNYCLKAAAKLNFKEFYKNEIKFRRELEFPPFRHLIEVGLRGRNKDDVFEQTRILFEELEKNKPKEVEILDLQPDILPKLRDKYRFTIMLKSKSVKPMLAFIKSALKTFKKRKNVVVTVNVDP